jgi:hypothetical protein
MTFKNDNLTDRERGLLGDRAADELASDQTWLGRRIEPVDLPAGLAERISGAVREELARRRRDRRAWAIQKVSIVAAAMLLLACSLWYVLVIAPGPNHVTPGGELVARPASTPVAAADREALLDAYESTTEHRDVQMVAALDAKAELLNMETAVPGNEPWAGLVESYDY